jgi:protein gp37
MADGTGIEWTDATWQVTHGCSLVSPGCSNCYAMRMAARLQAMGQKRYAGLTQPSKAGAVWSGVVRPCSDETLAIPLRWKRPRRIFVDSMSDLFHEDVPDEHIDKVFAVMALAPHHTFQVLTKRSARMQRWFASWPSGAARHHHIRSAVHALLRPRGDWSSRDPEWQKSIDAIDGCWPLPNVWLGVSVEDQQRADERIPDLLATLAALRFISAEPLLGPVVLDPLWLTASPSAAFASGEVTAHMPDWTRIGAHALDWVIAGGESGPRRRPVNPDWLRSLRDQCAAAGVAFFAKQLDKVAPIPPDLMVREFPA